MDISYKTMLTETNIFFKKYFRLFYSFSMCKIYNTAFLVSNNCIVLSLKVYFYN